MKTAQRLILVTMGAFCLLGSAACGDDGSEKATAAVAVVTEAPAATATPEAEGLLRSAEARYLPSMAPALAEKMRTQAWFETMTPAHLSLVAAIMETDKAAGARGERDSVLAAFEYAAEQPWYTDGLESQEAAELRGVFQTYTVSLSDWRAPQVGPVLASTIKYQLMAVVDLAESGDVVLMVSSDDEVLGREALNLAVEWLPAVEAVTGEFPYSFLHISVTDLPELYAGVSYDEFIALAPDSVTADVVVHELTHSTLYGIFPTWFEEGFAHFMEFYLTSSLEEGVAYFDDQLADFESDHRLNVGPKPGYRFYDHIVDRATGFLFVKGLYDIYGTDGLVETVRSLRTRTFTDQDLVKQLVETGDPEQHAALRAYVCANVIGTTRNYCD